MLMIPRGHIFKFDIRKLLAISTKNITGIVLSLKYG